jgi:hypothetical protein
MCEMAVRAQMELKCVMSLKWLGRLVEDRVDGLLKMM